MCLGLAISAVADTLALKNGQVLEGYFVGGNANGVTFVGQDGTSKTYPLSEVASMSYWTPASTRAEATRSAHECSGPCWDSHSGNRDGYPRHQFGGYWPAIHRGRWRQI
jgi:hypothetical protein